MDLDLAPLKAFTTSRPVMYGAPLAAVMGVLLGLAFQVGPQTEVDLQAEPVIRTVEDVVQPIAWPSGRVPDHVIGTDFLMSAAPPIYAEVRYDDEPDYRIEPPPIAAPIPDSAPIIVASAAVRDETRWASTQGDILDVRLPDDLPKRP